MGADLILYDLPACGIDDERRKLLLDLVKATDDLPDWYDSIADYQDALVVAIEHYEPTESAREFSVLSDHGPSVAQLRLWAIEDTT